MKRVGSKCPPYGVVRFQAALGGVGYAGSLKPRLSVFI